MSRSSKREHYKEGFDVDYEPKRYYDDGDDNDSGAASGSAARGQSRRESQRTTSHGKQGTRRGDDSDSQSERRHKTSKKDNPEWIGRLHESHSTKAMQQRLAFTGLWPRKGASDAEHLEAQITRKDASSKGDDDSDDGTQRYNTTMENYRNMNSLREHGISVKQFTGDPERPYETRYKNPGRPDKLDRNAVNKWSKP